jgi:hypothetical protein
MRRLWLWATIVATGGFAVWWSPEHVRLPVTWFVDRGRPVVNEDGPSADLATDRQMMWHTRPLTWASDPAARTKRASTPEAIEAASRVFNTVELVGLTPDEVVGRLGDPRAASDSIYNFPFWPPPDGAMVYRFDTGAYGWQFNVVIEDDRVAWVERHWIH